MPGTRRTTCEFFRVHYGTTPEHLDEILDHWFRANPLTTDRHYDDGESIYRLTDFSKTPVGCRGSLVKLRIGASAQKASLSSDVILDVPLGSDEHLVEYYSFCYYKTVDVIVVQRNRDVGTPNKLAAYIRDRTRRLGLQFTIVLKNDALSRLRTAGEPREAVLRFAVPKTNALFPTQNMALKKTIDIGQEMEAEYVTVIFSKGRKSGGLRHAGDFLTEAISHLGKKEKKRKDGVSAAKLKAKKNALSEDVFIDLIEDRMTEPVEVGYTGNKPITSDYYRAIDQAFNRREAELLEQYPPAHPH